LTAGEPGVIDRHPNTPPRVRPEDVMANKTNPIPKGLHTLTPNLVYREAAQAIDFYKKAFGAEELMRMPGPDGKGIWHAELRIGDSVFYMNDETPGMSVCRAPNAQNIATASLQVYVTDADASFKRAVDAGAKVAMPMADMFWGDRTGMVTDPYGHSWMISTHVKDLSPEEMKKGAEEAAKQMAAQQKKN
jgi:uncharacterized glyoxalase superfamily protein PhnB